MKVSKGHQKKNAYVRDSRLVKKICEKNQIIAKSTFFVYKTKDVDCIEKKFGVKYVGIRNTYKMRHESLKSIY